jgi:hypothetical protein
MRVQDLIRSSTWMSPIRASSTRIGLVEVGPDRAVHRGVGGCWEADGKDRISSSVTGADQTPQSPPDGR